MSARLPDELQAMKAGDRFAAEAGRRRDGFAAELLGFLLTNKKWWLGPIVLVLLLVSLLVVLAGTSIAPFIYTLF